MTHAIHIRLALAAVVSVALCAEGALAEPADSKSPKTSQSTGRTTVPETKGHKQPQGYTGPIDTDTGVPGAPAESPQGETPAGMQAAPEGSSKTTVQPK